MIEKPILFNTEMVKAILAGKKTQTRRVVKPQPKWEESPTFIDGFWCGRYTCFPGNPDEPNVVLFDTMKSKYNVGDRLWVRETFSYCIGSESFVYRADDHRANDPVVSGTIKWKPSIFMPRKVSRINLRITDVRIERLQRLTYENAIAEGILHRTGEIFGIDWYAGYIGAEWRTDPIIAFRDLWDSINGKRGYGWNKNPWVWVVEFEAVE